MCAENSLRGLDWSSFKGYYGTKRKISLAQFAH